MSHKDDRLTVPEEPRQVFAQEAAGGHPDEGRKHQVLTKSVHIKNVKDLNLNLIFLNLNLIFLTLNLIFKFNLIFII